MLRQMEVEQSRLEVGWLVARHLVDGKSPVEVQRSKEQTQRAVVEHSCRSVRDQQTSFWLFEHSQQQRFPSAVQAQFQKYASSLQLAPPCSVEAWLMELLFFEVGLGQMLLVDQV